MPRHAARRALQAPSPTSGRHGRAPSSGAGRSTAPSRCGGARVFRRRAAALTPRPARPLHPRRHGGQPAEQQQQQQAGAMDQREFFAEATEAQRYKLTEVIGKGSYGVVASAVDQFTGKR